MKKILAISFILLMGLMILGGCTSTTNQQQDQQNTNTETQQKSENRKDRMNNNFPTVKSFVHLTEFEEYGDVNMPYNMTKLTRNNTIILGIHGKFVKLDLIDFKSNDPNYEHKLYNRDQTQQWIVNDWAKIKINDDKIDIFPDEEMVKVELSNGDVVYLAAAMISDDYVQFFMTDKIKQIDSNKNTEIESQSQIVKECVLKGTDNLVVGIGKLCSTIKDCEEYSKYFDDIKTNFPNLACFETEFMKFAAGCKIDQDCYLVDEIVKRHDKFKETMRCKNNVCELTKGVAKLTGRLKINK